MSTDREFRVPLQGIPVEERFQQLADDKSVFHPKSITVSDVSPVYDVGRPFERTISVVVDQMLPVVNPVYSLQFGGILSPLGRLFEEATEIEVNSFGFGALGSGGAWEGTASAEIVARDKSAPGANSVQYVMAATHVDTSGAGNALPYRAPGPYWKFKRPAILSHEDNGVGFIQYEDFPFYFAEIGLIWTRNSGAGSLIIFNASLNITLRR